MLPAIFPDIYAILNKSEYLLCTKLRIVTSHFKIISRTRNYNNSFIINKNKCIQGRLRTPLLHTDRETSDTTVRSLPNRVFFYIIDDFSFTILDFMLNVI